MPSPTLRPREQADLARYRSFVVSQCGFVFDVTGWVTACPVTAALPALGPVGPIDLSKISTQNESEFFNEVNISQFY